jgi:prevent-host-death family protein
MTKVTAGEFQREFGRYRTVAQREAVVITNHGREDVVLISADDYARLRRYEQKALHVSELDDKTLERMRRSRPSKAAAKFDREWEK